MGVYYVCRVSVGRRVFGGRVYIDVCMYVSCERGGGWWSCLYMCVSVGRPSGGRCVLVYVCVCTPPCLLHPHHLPTPQHAHATHARTPTHNTPTPRPRTHATHRLALAAARV